MDEENLEEEIEEKQVIFTKGDVWIYDTVFNFWMEIRYENNLNSASFKRRMTHSCNIWKEKLFIFGGILENNDISGELMIFQL